MHLWPALHILVSEKRFLHQCIQSCCLPMACSNCFPSKRIPISKSNGHLRSQQPVCSMIFWKKLHDFLPVLSPDGSKGVRSGTRLKSNDCCSGLPVILLSDFYLSLGQSCRLCKKEKYDLPPHVCFSPFGVSCIPLDFIWIPVQLNLANWTRMFLPAATELR